MHAEKLRKQQEELDRAKIDIVRSIYFHSPPIKVSICNLSLTVRLLTVTCCHTIYI